MIAQRPRRKEVARKGSTSTNYPLVERVIVNGDGKFRQLLLQSGVRAHALPCYAVRERYAMSLIGQITGLRPTKSGIPKLTIQIAVESQFDTNVAILAVNTEVRVSASAHSYDAWGSAQFLGFAVWESYLSQLPKGGKSTWEVGLPLSSLQLQKIDEARDGRDIWLMAHSTFTAAVIPNTGTTNYCSFISGMLSDPSRSAGNCIYKIARSDWLKLRKELGYGEYLLIEIPLHISLKKGMAKALEHLQAASDHFAEDRADETLASCYKIFEYLAQKVGAKHPDQNGFEKLLGL